MKRIFVLEHDRDGYRVVKMEQESDDYYSIEEIKMKLYRIYYEYIDQITGLNEEDYQFYG